MSSTENNIEPAFVVDDDVKAEWALKKISKAEQDYQRYADCCDKMTKYYQEKKEKEGEKMLKDTSYLKTQLQAYLETVERNKTKTQETYKLPSGTLKMKYQQPEYQRNDNELITWLKERDKEEFVKMKMSVDWANFKKKLTVSEDKVVDENGEIVEGVKVIERAPVFNIDFKIEEGEE